MIELRTGRRPGDPMKHWRKGRVRERDFLSWLKIAGARLRDARVEADVTIFELARRVNLTVTTLRACELGRRAPSMAILFQVGRALGLDPRELLP